MLFLPIETLYHKDVSEHYTTFIHHECRGLPKTGNCYFDLSNGEELGIIFCFLLSRPVISAQGDWSWNQTGVICFLHDDTISVWLVMIGKSRHDTWSAKGVTTGKHSCMIFEGLFV